MNREETSLRNQEILKMKEEGYKQTAIAKKYHLTTCQVSRILKKMKKETEEEE